MEEIIVKDKKLRSATLQNGRHQPEVRSGELKSFNFL